MSAKYRILELTNGTHRLENRTAVRCGPFGIWSRAMWMPVGIFASAEEATERMKAIIAEETPLLVQRVHDYDERGQRTNLGW